MRELRRVGNYCGLNCGYCDAVGFLSAPLAEGPESADEELLSCNFPYGSLGKLVAWRGRALLHASLPEAVMAKSLADLKAAGIAPLLWVDRAGLDLNAIALLVERAGFQSEILVVARKSQDLNRLWQDIPPEISAKIFFPAIDYPDFYTADEIPFLLREHPGLISFAAGDQPYFNSLREKDYLESVLELGRNRKLRKFLLLAYRGGAAWFPARALLSLFSMFAWVVLDPRRFGDSVREALRESYWAYYKARTQVWGFYIAKPFGDFVVKPFGDFIVKPFGDFVVRPFGDFVAKPFGDFVLKPFSDFIVGPLGYRLPSFVGRNSVQGYWRAIEFGRFLRWCFTRPFFKLYYFGRYQLLKRNKPCAADSPPLDFEELS